MGLCKGASLCLANWFPWLKSAPPTDTETVFYSPYLYINRGDDGTVMIGFYSKDYDFTDIEIIEMMERKCLEKKT